MLKLLWTSKHDGVRKTSVVELLILEKSSLPDRIDTVLFWLYRKRLRRKPKSKVWKETRLIIACDVLMHYCKVKIVFVR